jgi:hypothetical protein
VDRGRRLAVRRKQPKRLTKHPGAQGHLLAALAQP